MQLLGSCFSPYVLLKSCGAGDGTQSCLPECVQCESDARVRRENRLCFPIYVWPCCLTWGGGNEADQLCNFSELTSDQRGNSAQSGLNYSTSHFSCLTGDGKLHCKTRSNNCIVYSHGKHVIESGIYIIDHHFPGKEKLCFLEKNAHLSCKTSSATEQPRTSPTGNEDTNTC